MSLSQSLPCEVGILAIELIFPPHYVNQNALEVHDGVSAGKYTVGLGQKKMAFCTDREDINSLCLTAVHTLLDRYNVSPSDIGRLDVGTETLVDKSKSVKSVLMQLFEGTNCDIEGVDSTNACYGGTAALFNALNWIESSAWDGRKALVVCGDIAAYAKGAARPTGGAGAVAMLVGPNAPLVVDRGVRASYMRHVYDFYKPNLSSEYPTVDGPLSIKCYLSALDKSYETYCKKSKSDISLQSFDYFLFHTPYCKLVQKSLARLLLNDAVRKAKDVPMMLQKYAGTCLEDTYFDKDIERDVLNASKPLFESMTASALHVAAQIGNMYTPSLYGGLVSLLISKSVDELAGSKIGLFSYGSGLAASMFSITVTSDAHGSLKTIVENLSTLRTQLEQRHEVVPAKFEATLELREKVAHTAPYEPVGSLENYLPGTYYLVSIDEKYRRTYGRIPYATNGHHSDK